MRFKKFGDGIGIRGWHHFGNTCGTAVRWKRWKPGLFGVWFRDGGLHLGFWWHVRLELVAIHVSQFKK